MGGLLIADAARDIAANTREGEPMWPKIVALVAFDTPVSDGPCANSDGAYILQYLGLHPVSLMRPSYPVGYTAADHMSPIACLCESSI